MRVLTVFSFLALFTSPGLAGPTTSSSHSTTTTTSTTTSKPITTTTTSYRRTSTAPLPPVDCASCDGMQALGRICVFDIIKTNSYGTADCLCQESQFWASSTQCLCCLNKNLQANATSVQADIQADWDYCAAHDIFISPAPSDYAEFCTTSTSSTHSSSKASSASSTTSSTTSSPTGTTTAHTTSHTTTSSHATTTTTSTRSTSTTRSTTSTTSSKMTTSTIKPTTSTSTKTTTSASGLPTGHVIRAGKNTGMCLTAAANNNQAAVAIEPCMGYLSQLWTYSGGSLHIFDNMCLDVTNGSTANGNKLQVYTCYPGNTNQQFYVTNDNRIAWTNKGECVDLTNGLTSAGNLIQMWACTAGNTNQVWYIDS